MSAAVNSACSVPASDLEAVARIGARDLRVPNVGQHAVGAAAIAAIHERTLGCKDQIRRSPPPSSAEDAARPAVKPIHRTDTGARMRTPPTKDRRAVLANEDNGLPGRHELRRTHGPPGVMAIGQLRADRVDLSRYQPGAHPSAPTSRPRAMMASSTSGGGVQPLCSFAMVLSTLMAVLAYICCAATPCFDRRRIIS